VRQGRRFAAELDKPPDIEDYPYSLTQCITTLAQVVGKDVLAAERKGGQWIRKGRMDIEEVVPTKDRVGRDRTSNTGYYGWYIPLRT
jgi:hypothetical protein